MIQEDIPIRTVGVIGAGVMGRQIADASVNAGMNVWISDVDLGVSEAAVEAIRSSNPRTRDLNGGLHHASHAPGISVAVSKSDLANVDIIIEAAPEDVALKTEILSGLESHLQPHAVMASNSSSLSISELAAGLQDPRRFCGLHFCHPVADRPLVEVVATATTSRETLNRAHTFAVSLGMNPLVVRDSPGFLLNRLLVPFMNEALELVLHGANIATLDRAARDFGMPIRPLALFDEFGLDVALAVGRSMYRAWPDRIPPSELLIAMYKSGQRGRKQGDGFYASAEEAEMGRLSSVAEAIIMERQRSESVVSDEQATRQLFLPMYLEATRALEESLATSPDVIDKTLGDGLGMTRRYRGLFGWANSIGPATILEWLRLLEPLGPRFEPTSMLCELVADHCSFPE